MRRKTLQNLNLLSHLNAHNTGYKNWVFIATKIQKLRAGDDDGLEPSKSILLSDLNAEWEKHKIDWIYMDYTCELNKGVFFRCF